MTTTNPLLQTWVLPPYAEIRAEHVVPAITHVIESNLRQLALVLPGQLANPTFDGLLKPLEDMRQRLLAVQQAVHRLSKAGDEAIAAQYALCTQQVLDYEAALKQNKALHGALLLLQASPAFGRFDRTQRAALELALREARLAGTGYEPKVHYRCLQLSHELEKHYDEYGTRLGSAQAGWTRHIVDVEQLNGASPSMLLLLAERARENGLTGWLITLDLPVVKALLTELNNRSLREQIYRAYQALANIGDRGNGPVIQRILKARDELATLSGYPHYAAFAQATRMFSGHNEVAALLTDLVSKVRPLAQRELARLNEMARTLTAPNIEPWDVEYYRERYRRAYYGVADLTVREYFPIAKVVPGLSLLCEQLFHVELFECAEFPAWNTHVRLFEMKEAGEVLGYVYIDLLARPGKRPGAWMEALRDRHTFADGTVQLPMALLGCDFIEGTEGHPTLLNLTEVKTLLHKFGHALHHILTQVDHASVAGIKGVADDAIELPSMLLEKWAMQPESLRLFSGHYQTGDAAPEAFLNKALEAQAQFVAWDLYTQLEFALIDYELHRRSDVDSPEDVVRATLADVELLRTPDDVYYIHSFAHLFVTSDYAAGYYTYAWSQMMAAHLFARFRQDGVLSSEAGRALRHLILAKGGTWPMLELIDQFIASPPSSDALLKELGSVD